MTLRKCRPVWALGLGFLMAACCALVADQTPAASGGTQPAVKDGGDKAVPKAAGEASKEDLKAVVDGNNEFAFDLYRRLAETEKGNIIFSPYSISTALAMTYAGARGKTAEEMAKVLHFTLPQERLHPAVGALMADLQNGNKARPFQLNVANALWGQAGYQFGKEFLRLTQKNYGGGLKEIDFAGNPEQARETINSWVEEQTKDKIKGLLLPGDIKEKTRFALANAIYFKANWKKPFDPKQTKDAPFELPSGEKRLVPMMHSKVEPFQYAATDDFQWLEIFYDGDRLSMLFLLPRKKERLYDLEKNLTASVIVNGAKKLRMAMGEVALPRFKVAARFDLLKTLENMRMPLGPFDVIGKDFELHFVAHKAYTDVDETGTEAAAATGGGGGPGSGASLPFSFRADHPFLFLIRDRLAGSILFQGRVANPGH